MPVPATSKWGRNGEERAALLRVRTCPKALRAVGGSFFKLWEGERKINRPEHIAGGSQNKGTKKLQRRAGPSLLEVGGSGEGKGANSAPEKPPPPTRQTGPGSYLKTSWVSTGGARWGRRGKRPTAPGERSPKPLAAPDARRGGKRRTASGERAPSLWLPEPLRPRKTQHAGSTESALLWRTGKLEPHSTQGALHIEQPGAWAV